MAAARLSTFASKVTTTLAPARSKVVESYSKMMADNAQYVVTDAAVEDKLLKQYVGGCCFFGLSCVPLLGFGMSFLGPAWVFVVIRGVNSAVTGAPQGTNDR